MVCCMLELYLLLSQLFWFSGNNKLYKYLLRELEFFVWVAQGFSMTKEFD